jgi:hypothetical protein
MLLAVSPPADAGGYSYLALSEPCGKEIIILSGMGKGKLPKNF